MDFANALMALKLGQKARCKTWNNRKNYIQAQVPDEHSKMTEPYFYMVIPSRKEGGDDSRIPWQPSQHDLFSEDWEFVE